MTEYIEREAAINRIKEAIPYHDNSITGLERAIGYLQAIPAADVRPVVMCRDCIIRQYCKVTRYLGADGFCSNGTKGEKSI